MSGDQRRKQIHVHAPEEKLGADKEPRPIQFEEIPASQSEQELVSLVDYSRPSPWDAEDCGFDVQSRF